MSPAANDPTAVRVDVTIGVSIDVGRSTVEAIGDTKVLLELVERHVNEAGGVLIVREVLLA